MEKKVRLLLILLLITVFLFSAWKLLETYNAYGESRIAYEGLKEFVAPANTKTDKSKKPLEYFPLQTEENPEKPDVSDWPQVDFEELSKINPDIVGWIYIEGTNIDYPVVQSADNDYYLNRMFDGSENRSGCIFLDYRCSDDFTDRHSIIYGHHMKDQRMFSALMGYKEQAFYEAHPTALLVTPTAYYRIQLFSAYIADDWANAWELELDDSNAAAWLQELQAKSCFAAEKAPGSKDRIVTLSTCTYEFEDAKFLVHGYISEEIPNLQ